jgi:NADH-quinone oxidoreductase subunit J
LLSLILLGELCYLLAGNQLHPMAAKMVDGKQVGIALFGPYLLVVELASMLLLAALVAAYHLGRHDEKE